MVHGLDLPLPSCRRFDPFMVAIDVAIRDADQSQAVAEYVMEYRQTKRKESYRM